MAKITVGLPAYNAEPWIRQTINALLEQTYSDFVLLISDNASTDNTGRICEELARTDSRIVYRRNRKNIGVFRNHQKVLWQAETPYFKWASANDLCAPQFFEACLDALEANPAAVLAYPSTVVFTDDPERGEKYLHDLDLRQASASDRFRQVLTELRLNNPFNGVVRTSALRHVAMDTVYYSSDVVLMAELALRGQIMRLPRFLFFRRMSPAAMSAKRDSEGQREFFASEGRDVLSFPTWDFYRHCFSGILRAPIPAGERARCAAFVARACWWKRRDLWHEVVVKLTGSRVKLGRSSTI